MNIIYSDICQKILGEYSEKNKYHSQLLYLLCYISEVRNVTDTDRLINTLKVLKKEASIGYDVIYNKLSAESKRNDTKSGYGEDFNIRCELYYYSISFDVRSENINHQAGYERHAGMINDLYKMCNLYYIIIGKKCKFSRDGRRVRENIYSCIRNWFIGYRNRMCKSGT